MVSDTKALSPNPAMQSSSLEAIKDRLPEYLQSLGLELKLKGGNKLSCRCPLHADSKPSFTATRKGHAWLWFCFPCNKGGSIIDLHAAIHGTGTADAIKELGGSFGGPLFASLPAPAPKPQERTPAAWPALRIGREEDLAMVATLRHLPLEALRHAQRLGYLRFVHHYGRPCFALTDEAHVFRQLRTIDGSPFRHGESWDKAHNMSGSRMVPLGTKHLGEGQPVLIAEGAIALLELLALLHLTARLDSWTWAFLAMTSASTDLPEDVLQKLRGRRIRIISDVDPAGRTARDRWTAQLYSVGCYVEHAHLNTLPELAGLPQADLGDLLKLPFSDQKQAILNSLIL